MGGILRLFQMTVFKHVRQIRLGLIIPCPILIADTLLLVEELKAQFDVRLFHSEADTTMVPGEVDCATIRSRASVSAWIWTRLFRYFGNIPKSRANYEVLTRFALENIRSPLRRLYAERIAHPLRMKMPTYVPYDRLLDRLRNDVTSGVEDVDAFLFFTHIGADGLLARALRLQRPVFCYVYSWDHPCKLSKFSRRVNYLLWNQDLCDDLCELNDVPRTQAHSVGSTQLTLVNRWRATVKPPHEEARVNLRPRVLFLCATGYQPLVEQEIAFILHLRRLIDNLRVSLDVDVRTYPYARRQNAYAALHGIPGVTVLPATTKCLRSIGAVYEKYEQASRARVALHFGSTIGLELVHTDCPVCIVDYYSWCTSTAARRFPLSAFVHQYQNEKYLLRSGLPNVLKSDNELRSVLSEAGAGALPGRYAEYSEELRHSFPAEPMKVVAGSIARHIRDAAS